MQSARLATFAYFALNGFVLGVWIVHIPAIEHRVGISHAVLGWLLLLLGAGAFVGMQLVGPLTDRFGARRVVPLSAALCSAALVLPALAGNAWTLGVALLVFGVGNGSLDVSMNAHAVQVEAGYRRPIMSAFHAVFSIGGVLAALVGARTLGWGWSTTATLGVVSLLALAVATVAAPALLSGRAAASTPDRVTGRAGTWRTTPLRIWALAALALMLMLSEGVANDWSVLAMRDVLDAPAATAALAYGTFATAMTIGRLLTDRVAARFGPVAIVRYGSALAALALVAVAVAPSIPLAIAGWTLFGIGLSGTIPQLFSAAGHADPTAAGANVSRVAGLGYLGVLAGPAVIGPLTHFMPLNHTFFLPAAFCVVAALSAHILRPATAELRPPSDERPAASVRTGPVESARTGSAGRVGDRPRRIDHNMVE
ncbi:MFS transporter [Plantactinospora endophytica]|uniref:MFS transporter n=1 Tax=Plantactinospora endophytica TaxID=673535 RepID=A0ABQ4E6S2_9ACTN|nr:MFS transporter [Plantactinospora endophytica]